MDEEQLKFLQSQDWPLIATKMFNAGRVFAARKGWTDKNMLPMGRSLEGLVHETITEIWENPGRINPEVDLTVQLKNIVRSKLYNLAKRCDGQIDRSGILRLWSYIAQRRSM
jgi:hypothetical protein